MGLDFKFEIEIGWFDKRNAILARKHETGDGVPVRSHLLKVANSKEFYEYIKTPFIANKISKNINKAGEIIANEFIKYYQNFVLSNKVTPKLSPVTIKKKIEKGSKYPTITLVDTSQMIKSIIYKVVK